MLLHPLAGLAPIVIVGEQIEMQKLVESDSITLFNAGARGAIVTDDEGIVGVLPSQIIDDFLGSGESLPPINTMNYSFLTGDSSLAGRYRTPKGYVQCVAVIDSFPCGYTNNVVFFDASKLPRCKNPSLPEHTLTLG